MYPDGCVRCPACEGCGWKLPDPDYFEPLLKCAACEGRGWIDEND